MSLYNFIFVYGKIIMAEKKNENSELENRKVKVIVNIKYLYLIY